MNLFELFVKIGVEDQASGKLKDLGGKLGNGLKTAAKIGTAAVGAAAAGITALTTAAVNNYAEYEQLVGGVDTLFKSSSQKVQEYAANAYKTAGMSANEYMSTVTSFSASLLQSLGGDTEAAAEYANQALTDMSDNANKMGTSMEMIQNAYQGFAKQNYTMLDNLKLGYGGTKEEMARLIEDAAKLSDTVDAQDMSFANIVKAINVVQTEMGITGTTAKEAASTIQGSVGMMKSSWTNLVTGIADENANLDVLITNFVDSVGTVAQNIVPKIGVALNSASKLISDLIPVIVQEIPTLIEENLPILAEAAISIIQSLVDGISENQEMLMTTAFETITYLATSLISMLPKIYALGLDLLVSLANGIAESLPELIPTIVDVILQIVNTLTSPDQLKTLLNAALTLVLELTKGIVDAVPNLIDAALQLVNNLIDFILDEENLNSIIDAALEIILVITEGLVKAIPQLVDATIQIIEKLCDFFLDPENISMLLDMAFEIVVAIANGIIDATPKLIEGAFKLIDSLITTFIETDWIEIGRNIVNGVLTGLKNAWGSIKEWFSNSLNSLVGGVKDLLGIHSPSRLFAGIGENMALGLGEGWDDEFSVIKNGIKNGLDFGVSKIGFSDSGIGKSQSNAYSFNTPASQDIVINLTSVIDGTTLARTQYRYNMREANLRGNSLVEVYG